jgi:hypothetical protein
MNQLNIHLLEDVAPDKDYGWHQMEMLWKWTTLLMGPNLLNYRATRYPSEIDVRVAMNIKHAMQAILNLIQHPLRQTSHLRVLLNTPT